MTSKNSNSSSTWTGTQAYVLAVVCLIAGVAIGYLLRGSASPATDATVQAAATGNASTGGMPQGMGMQQAPTPEQLKHMADKQAEPLLAELSKNPNDPVLLYKIGNMYYDAQQFPDAVQYYERSLKLDPTATDVRTDMATAYHFMGQADKAISEYEEVLKTDPKHANALFNEGMVKWQDKMDMKGAIASWKKLLATNPDYAKKDQVENLIAKAEQHLNIKPGTKTDKPANIQ